MVESAVSTSSTSDARCPFASAILFDEVVSARLIVDCVCRACRAASISEPTRSRSTVSVRAASCRLRSAGFELRREPLVGTLDDHRAVPHAPPRIVDRRRKSLVGGAALRA